MAYQTNRRARFDRLAYWIAQLFDSFHTFCVFSNKNWKREMTILKIEAKITPADQPLQDYQVIILVNFASISEFWVTPYINLVNSNNDFQSGKADDFEVLCRDGSFGIHLYCLFNSDFLYKQYKARENFEGEGKGVQSIYCLIFTVYNIQYNLYSIN